MTWNLSDKVIEGRFVVANAKRTTNPYYAINVMDVKEFIKRFKDEIKANADVDDAINLLDKLAGEKLK